MSQFADNLKAAQPSEEVLRRELSSLLSGDDEAYSPQQ